MPLDIMNSLNSDVMTVTATASLLIGDNIGEIPTGTRRGRFAVQTAGIRYSDSTSTAPTTSAGNILYQDDVLDLTDDKNWINTIRKMRVILDTTTVATLWMEFFS